MRTESGSSLLDLRLTLQSLPPGSTLTSCPDFPQEWTAVCEVTEMLSSPDCFWSMCSVTAIETLTKIEQGLEWGADIHSAEGEPSLVLVGVKARGGGAVYSAPNCQGSSLWDGASQFSCSLAVTPPVVTTMNLPDYKALSDPTAHASFH